MHITLIGMSGVGKTWHSRRLAKDFKYEHLNIDEDIERMLAPALSRMGYRGIADVAKWMGHPYEDGYAENSELYLRFEKESVKQALDLLDNFPIGSRVVFDATGSVVYLPKALLERLKQKTTIIYLEATAEHEALLYENYIADPRPVIWGDKFVPMPGESHMQTLRRCYPDLLHWRAERYKALSDITIPYLELRKEGFDAPWLHS